MKRQICLLLLMISCNQLVKAQNNPIFGGGNNDGWDSVRFIQPFNNIFTGGNGDGWDSTKFIQSANNIFTGGNGDGWDSTRFIQLVNNIFAGGNGDGWDSTIYLQAGNNIFRGGTGDGWDSTRFLQSSNNIFPGGIGDGWSSTYRPSSPVPVTFSYFTAEKYNKSMSLLRWETLQEMNSAYFDIERSTDAIFFERIGTVTAAGNSQLATKYSFVDQQPVKGFNYYRLKQVDRDGRFIYTPARMLRFDDLSVGIVRYFPNPTHGLLTIIVPQEWQSMNRVINVSNVSGIVLEQVRLPAGSSQQLLLDLSKYPKGVYFIQVSSGNSQSSQRIALQ